MLQSGNGNHRSSGTSFPFNVARQLAEPASSQAILYAPSRAASRRLDLATDTVYMRMNRWSKNGVRDRVFEYLQREQIVRIPRGGFDGQHHRQGPSRWYGCVKKNGPQAIGKSRGGWTTKIHRGCYSRNVLPLSRTGPRRARGAEVVDTPWLTGSEAVPEDRAYEGNETRQLALALGFTPVVPPLSTRVDPWDDREMYKRRNEIERLFRRLKGFRRIFSRFEKLDTLFLGFILFALIFDALR